MSIEISIIVPVYNAEKYLERCVNSILRQSFSDFELLLIDDGSKAPCAELCDILAARDSRIRVFHTKNGGTSAARNWGLDNASGRYIAFADSDDYVLDNWLTDMYRTAVLTDADFVKSGVYLVSPDDYSETKDGMIQVPIHPLETIQYQCSTLSDFDFLKNLAVGGYGAVWNQLIRAELFRSFRFPVGKLAEDVKICAELCQAAQHIERIDSIGYCYVQYPTSQLHLASESFVEDNIDTWLWLSHIYLEKYGSRERSNFAKAYAVNGFFAHSCSSVRINTNYGTEDFLRKWSKLKTQVTYREIAPYLSPRIRIQYLVFSISPKLYKLLMNLLKNHG